MSLFKGHARQRGFAANLIKIPDPSEKIRAQGLQQLRYMQEELDTKNQYARDLQEVFNQNIQLEQNLREDQWQDRREYSQTFAKAKWKNYETSINNAKIKADQKRRDFEGILNLTKTGAQLVKQYDTKRKQDIDNFAAEIYRDYGVNQKKFDAIRSWQKGIRVNDQNLNGMLNDLQMKGVPLDVISRIRRGGGYMQLAVGKLAAQRRAKGLGQYFAENANTELELPGGGKITLAGARGPNVETALQELTSRYFRDENGEQLFSSKMMELGGVNKLIDEAKMAWRQRDTEKTAKEELQDQHKSTITVIQDFIGYDPDLERNVGAAGIPKAIEHLAGGPNATRAQFRYAKRRVQSALVQALKEGTIKWDQIKGLETLPVSHKSSKEKQPWGKINRREFQELEKAGLAYEDHADAALKLKEADLRREGREYYENMVKLQEDYEGNIPESVMQSMIGYGVKRGTHFAKGVQYLQKIQAYGLSTINDKVGTKALLAKSERGEIITDEDISSWNLSKSVEQQVRAQVKKYNTWLPQEGKDGTKERLNYRIETALNDIVEKKTSWHESVTWNDTRIKANQDAARYYRTARESGMSHEKSYEYARDMIAKDIASGGKTGYYKKVSKNGRHEFAGALAKKQDVIEVNRDQIFNELSNNPDIIFSKKYIDNTELRTLSAKANRGTWPEMHPTAMLIQSITKGEVQAVDVMQAQLQQLINEETQAGGASTTKLLPKAYVEKYKKTNEIISPFAMHLLESYELCDINKACMTQREDGTINKPVYTAPILEKVSTVNEEVQETGGTEQQKFLLKSVGNLLNDSNNPTFTSPFGMHEPSLLSSEAYDWLWTKGRYNSLITPATRGQI